MAITAAGAALTAQQRRTQALIRTTILTRLGALWPLLDPERLDETSPGWVDATTSLVRGGHALSARAAASYYLAFRQAEGVAGTVNVLAAVLDLDAVRTSLIVTGPVAIKKATAVGVPLTQSVPNALTMVSGTVGRHVETGSWDTITGAVRSDTKAQGWARVVSGDGCAFCQMLASRGPVYRSEETADFEAHDHCSCGIEPVLGSDYQWPATSVAAREKWDALKTADGGPGANLPNFRRAVAAE